MPLRPDDGDDPLLLVITPEVQVALALHGPSQKRQLLVRCDPATLSDVLVQLGGRLEHQSPAQAEQLRKALESIGSCRAMQPGQNSSGHGSRSGSPAQPPG